MPLTPAERSANARKAALQRSATEDTRAMNDAARRVFRQSFEPSEPAGDSPEAVAERQRRGYAAYRVYMQDLARKSAETRQARKAALQQAAAQARRTADALAELADVPDGQV